MIRHFTKNDFKEMDWKNGQGKTCELLRIPNPHDEGQFYLRLSIARVESSGPFSLYPGFDRHLILLNGKGMLLNFEDGRTTRLTHLLNMTKFTGESQIRSQLIDGPSEDFNVIVDRKWGRTNVEVTQKLTISPHFFIYQIQTGTLWEIKDENNFSLKDNFFPFILIHLTESDSQ